MQTTSNSESTRVVKQIPKTKTNKQAFLEEGAFDEPNYYMPASDLPTIALHYRDKNIPILMNGSTPEKYALIQKKKEPYERWAKKFKEFPLATYVVEKSYYSSIYDKLTNKFADEEKIIDFNNVAATLSMSDEHLRKFQNSLIETLSEQDIKEIEKNLPKYERDLNHSIKELCLSGKESIEEMLDLQKLMEEKNYNGFFVYISTSGVAISPGHFDTFFISKKAIIQTPFYSGRMNEKEYNENFKSKLYSSSLEGFLPRNSEVPHPQARGYPFCASLGLANAKKLLEYNAFELRHHTLMFNFYSENGKLNRFFMTSPAVLRYSQSHSYNELLKDMLMKGNESIFFSKNRTEIYSLEKALNISITIAAEKGDVITAEENSDLLIKKLPKFRQKWIEGYSDMLLKRDVLKDPDTGLNHQLAYRAQKYKKIGERSQKMSLGECYTQIASHFFTTPAVREPTMNYKLDKFLLESKIDPNSTDDSQQPLLQVAMQAFGKEKKENHNLINWEEFVENNSAVLSITQWWSLQKKFPFLMAIDKKNSACFYLKMSLTDSNKKEFYLKCSLIYSYFFIQDKDTNLKNKCEFMLAVMQVFFYNRVSPFLPYPSSRKKIVKAFVKNLNKSKPEDRDVSIEYILKEMKRMKAIDATPKCTIREFNF